MNLNVHCFSITFKTMYIISIITENNVVRIRLLKNICMNSIFINKIPCNVTPPTVLKVILLFVQKVNKKA